MIRASPKILLGKRITAARERLKMTQPELAAACKWFRDDGNPAQTRVSNYERGVREPGVEEVMLIAKATGKKLLYFYDFQDELQDTEARANRADQITRSLSMSDAMQIIEILSTTLPAGELARASALFSAALLKTHEEPDT